jgi:hypothetical protein
MRILSLVCVALVVGLTPAAHGQTPLATGREQFEAGDLASAFATLLPIAPTDGSAAPAVIAHCAIVAARQTKR